jgi:hypothetical protein
MVLQRGQRRELANQELGAHGGPCDPLLRLKLEEACGEPMRAAICNAFEGIEHGPAHYCALYRLLRFIEFACGERAPSGGGKGKARGEPSPPDFSVALFPPWGRTSLRLSGSPCARGRAWECRARK